MTNLSQYDNIMVSWATLKHITGKSVKKIIEMSWLATKYPDEYINSTKFCNDTQLVDSIFALSLLSNFTNLQFLQLPYFN